MEAPFPPTHAGRPWGNAAPRPRPCLGCFGNRLGTSGFFVHVNHCTFGQCMRSLTAGHCASGRDWCHERPRPPTGLSLLYQGGAVTFLPPSHCMVRPRTAWSALALPGPPSHCMVHPCTTWSTLALHGPQSEVHTYSIFCHVTGLTPARGRQTSSPTLLISKGLSEL